MPTLGKPAPSFTLPSTSGHDLSLTDLRGQRVVLYFYPRDDTPGCTREACGFRDAMKKLHAAGVKVLGISKDSLASHAKFRTKYSLPFELLSDADNVVAKKYSAFGHKKMYGKDVLGTIRSTFLIDEQGKVARVWSPVKVDGHVDAVLEALAGTPALDSKLGRTSTKSSSPSASAKKSAPRSIAATRNPASRTSVPSKQPAARTASSPRKKSARSV